jgi:hypothetical protein
MGAKLPYTLMNNRTFRGVWWFLTLPLEAWRGVMLPISAAIRLVSFNQAAALWLLLLAVLWYTTPAASFWSFQFVIHNKWFTNTLLYGGVALFLGRKFPAFFAEILTVPTPKWRLGAIRTPKQKTPEITSNQIAP